MLALLGCVLRFLLRYRYALIVSQSHDRVVQKFRKDAEISYSNTSAHLGVPIAGNEIQWDRSIAGIGKMVEVASPNGV